MFRKLFIVTALLASLTLSHIAGALAGGPEAAAPHEAAARHCQSKLT